MQKVLFILMVLMMPIAGKAADAGTSDALSGVVLVDGASGVSFMADFSYGGEPFHIRTVNIKEAPEAEAEAVLADPDYDNGALASFWKTVVHQAVTAPETLPGRLEAQRKRLAGEGSDDGPNPYAWMVIEGKGGIEAVFMTGHQPTKAPYDPENEEHVLFMGLLTKLCGIDYSGGDPKEAKREGNKGLAAMPPAFPPALVADGAKAAAFIKAGFAAVVYLRGQGHVLRDASTPAAVTAIIDPALRGIYEAAGFTVETEEYLRCLTADRAVRYFAWRKLEEAAAGEASSAAAATTD